MLTNTIDIDALLEDFFTTIEPSELSVVLSSADRQVNRCSYPASLNGTVSFRIGCCLDFYLDEAH